VKKTLIKVIKRKDVEVLVNTKTKTTSETEPTTKFNEEKVERRLHRKMANTVSNWISERKENNRIKEISAIRRLFADESLLSKTAY
jgi:hypothetical protein